MLCGLQPLCMEAWARHYHAYVNHPKAQSQKQRMNHSLMHLIGSQDAWKLHVGKMGEALQGLPEKRLRPV